MNFFLDWRDIFKRTGLSDIWITDLSVIVVDICFLLFLRSIFTSGKLAAIRRIRNSLFKYMKFHVLITSCVLSSYGTYALKQE